MADMNRMQAARAELARRELARRGKSVDTEIAPAKQPSMIEQVGTGVTDIAKSIINPVYRTGAGVLQGAEGVAKNVFRGKAPWTSVEMTTYKNPITGDVVEPAKNIKEAAGTAAQTAALIPGMSAARVGGLFMGGQALSEDRPIPEVILKGAGGAALGKGLELLPGGITKVKEGLAGLNDPKRLMTKAQKITTEILQPSKTELASYLERGKTMPAVEEATKAITKPVKNYTELRTNIDDVIKKSFSKRKEIFAKNNFKIGGEYLDDLRNLIKDTETMGQATPQEIGTMKEVLTREEQFIKSNPNLNRLSAQARKEKLQDLTHKLLEKREGGEIIDREPARNLALDAIRRGLKKAVNADDAEVTAINDAYDGLRNAKWLVSGQEALAQKAVPENILKRLVRFVTNPKDIAAETARGVLNYQGGLFNKTKELSGLVKKATTNKTSAFRAPIR